MRSAVLLYNPNSGRGRDRAQIIECVAALLRNNSLEVTVCATEGPGTAGTQAAAAADSADTVFACGGDGTIHEVIQGLAFHPTASLGIIPLGSANVLARHLKLSLNPVQAAEQQINRRPTSVPLGRVTYMHASSESTRYFIALVGAGPDGALTYRMLAKGKQRFGRFAYYVRAAQLFARTRFSSFDLHATTTAGEEVSLPAMSAMAIRVNDLGGLFGPLARGASIHDPHLALTVVSSASRWALPMWFAMSWARAGRWNRMTRTLLVREFSCGASATTPVQVQADGEWLGRTPMTVSLVPNALRLLLP